MVFDMLLVKCITQMTNKNKTDHFFNEMEKE